MKFNKYTYGLLSVAMALAAAACDEDSWNDKIDGFEVPPVYPTTQVITYTLTDADYATIAGNSANKDLAETDGETELLEAIGKGLEFPSEEAARKYIPAFLSSAYYYLNNGSDVKVTYNLAGNQPAEVLAINAGIKAYTVTDADYQQAWGSDDDYIAAFAPAATAANNIPGLLAAAYPDAQDGAYVAVNYREAAVNPVFGTATEPDAPSDVVVLEQKLNQSFDDCTAENVSLAEGLDHVWFASSYNGVGYMRATAFDSKDKVTYAAEAYLVTPLFSLEGITDAVLTFSQEWNYFSSVEAAQKEATVWAREKGGEWKQLAVPNQCDQVKKFEWKESGDVSLAAFEGKEIQIGFRFLSDGIKCGTWDVRDIIVKGMKGAAAKVQSRAPLAEVSSAPVAAIYTLDGGKWKQPSDTYVLQTADYTAMGSTYGNLTPAQATSYLPTWLDTKLPYAGDEAKCYVVYRRYANKVTDWYAAQYTKADGTWTPNTGAITDKFTRKDGAWSYNPSIEITLPKQKTGVTFDYYTAAIEWVFENISKKLDPNATIKAPTAAEAAPFIDYRGNAEYYSGVSSFYGNIDLRASTALTNAPKDYEGYKGLSEEEVELLIKKRLCTETMLGAVTAMNPDARPAEGMEVTCTVTFDAYTGEDKMESIVYIVTGPGQFKYKSSTIVTDGDDKDW